MNFKTFCSSMYIYEITIKSFLLLRLFFSRVKMEIGPTPHHPDREPSFASPRKRFLKEYPDGQSPAKHRRLSTEHRLSTDSLGSTGDRASPYLPHRGNSPLPHAAGSRTAAGGSNSQDVKPFTAFSIDNLISGSQAAAAARLAASSAAQSSSSPSRYCSKIIFDYINN